MRDRLVTYSALSDDEPARERAERLAERLFAEGLSFLLLPYLSQHAESQKRLEVIARDGLDKELRTLVGARFVDELKQAHEDYGAVLGITVARPEVAPALRVVEPLREVQAALRAYTLQLLALAESDEGALSAVRAALRLIDVVRTASGRRGGGPTNEPEPPMTDGGGGEPPQGSDLELVPGSRFFRQQLSAPRAVLGRRTRRRRTRSARTQVASRPASSDTAAPTGQVAAIAPGRARAHPAVI